MIWKDINNIEGIPDGKYEVSDEGCVRRKGCRCVKPFHNRRYLMVKLVHLGIEKTVSVHRLVASAFIPNPEHKREVNHIDANPENNRGRRETAYGFQWRYINPSKGVETKISAANMTTNRRAQIEREDKDTFRSALLSYIAEKR